MNNIIYFAICQLNTETLKYVGTLILHYVTYGQCVTAWRLVDAHMIAAARIHSSMSQTRYQRILPPQPPTHPSLLAPLLLLPLAKHIIDGNGLLAVSSIKVRMIIMYFFKQCQSTATSGEWPSLEPYSLRLFCCPVHLALMTG